MPANQTSPLCFNRSRQPTFLRMACTVMTFLFGTTADLSARKTSCMSSLVELIVAVLINEMLGAVRRYLSIRYVSPILQTLNTTFAARHKSHSHHTSPHSYSGTSGFIWNYPYLPPAVNDATELRLRAALGCASSLGDTSFIM